MYANTGKAISIGDHVPTCFYNQRIDQSSESSLFAVQNSFLWRIMAIASPPYIYIYIYIHTYTHIYIYIYISLLYTMTNIHAGEFLESAETTTRTHRDRCVCVHVAHDNSKLTRARLLDSLNDAAHGSTRIISVGCALSLTFRGELHVAAGGNIRLVISQKFIF